ncbi:MAG: nitrogen fixation protein NifX [Candidatus Competibacteraceae bacterium]|nr:nitrogen fixation protein NifX [Candidatus Competibacteraceae bacterium]
MALNRHWWIVNGGTEVQAMTTANIRVAFATSDRKRVDQHFGTACALAIYAITPQQATLVEFAQFGELEADGHEDKLQAKMALLHGCVAVYCQAVGGSAIRQLLTADVQPFKVAEGTLIEPLLHELQAALNAGSKPWLNQALRRRQSADSSRFDVMAAEGWQE